jgi:hypothetical protein
MRDVCCMRDVFVPILACVICSSSHPLVFPHHFGFFLVAVCLFSVCLRERENVLGKMPKRSLETSNQPVTKKPKPRCKCKNVKRGEETRDTMEITYTSWVINHHIIFHSPKCNDEFQVLKELAALFDCTCNFSQRMKWELSSLQKEDGLPLLVTKKFHYEAFKHSPQQCAMVYGKPLFPPMVHTDQYKETYYQEHPILNQTARMCKTPPWQRKLDYDHIWGMSLAPCMYVKYSFELQRAGFQFVPKGWNQYHHPENQKRIREDRIYFQDLQAAVHADLLPVLLSYMGRDIARLVLEFFGCQAIHVAQTKLASCFLSKVEDGYVSLKEMATSDHEPVLQSHHLLENFRDEQITYTWYDGVSKLDKCSTGRSFLVQIGLYLVVPIPHFQSQVWTNDLVLEEWVMWTVIVRQTVNYLNVESRGIRSVPEDKHSVGISCHQSFLSFWDIGDVVIGEIPELMELHPFFISYITSLPTSQMIQLGMTHAKHVVQPFLQAMTKFKTSVPDGFRQLTREQWDKTQPCDHLMLACRGTSTLGPHFNLNV